LLLEYTARHNLDMHCPSMPLLVIASLIKRMPTTMLCLQVSTDRPPLATSARSGLPPAASPASPGQALTAAATAVTAAAAVGANTLSDFDEELSDQAPPAVNVLKPFEDPLGLL
jgi:hypothetical protein